MDKFSEAEEQLFAGFCNSDELVGRYNELLAEHEGDLDGLADALQNEGSADPRYKFDPLIILILIKLAPLIWVLIKNMPNIIQFIRDLRRRRRQLGGDE